jgi:hypothetical protein
MNGYFIFQKPNSAIFYLSALYDGLTGDLLDFATAESNPDPLVRVLANNGQLLLFGGISTEFWGDSGAADFPFARIGGSAIEWGLAARGSLCKYDNSLAFLRANRLGQVQVCVLVGYNATPISTPELDHVINSYSSVSDATAFAYMLGGHAFYQINFPSANNGAGQSWLYDNQSNSWSKVGGEYARHRAELQMQYLNQSIVTDYENGLTYSLNENVYTDNGAPIVRQLIGRHQATGDFSKIGRMWLEMEAGVGLTSGQGENPQVMLQISRDGGHVYGAELWRSFGRIGKFRARALWLGLGRARDWTMKLRVTDAVKVVFVACWATYSK